ncbi:MAG TPA: phosphatase, partial [Chroococcales cyanobacterium]
MDPSFFALRDRLLPRMRETRLVGDNTRHSRKDNLLAIQRLIEGHWHYTFGIEGLKLGTPEEVLRQISEITGCSSDIHYEEGGGHISAEKAFGALLVAAGRLKECRGKIFLGT